MEMDLIPSSCKWEKVIAPDSRGRGGSVYKDDGLPGTMNAVSNAVAPGYHVLRNALDFRRLFLDTRHIDFYQNET
jgi:hypothetical protein